ncbi:MAG: ABC transporter ATP-binding protein [Anaerolineaceae bacterium]|nr:ABC transporter ATP-binding protein [Anaerolineaceae bacterium]
MNSTIRWLWKVTGRKKAYILALTLLQAIGGGMGVLYALFLRNIVDSAVGKNADDFRHYVFLIIGLVIAQLLVSALIRRIHELARADIENAFKQRLLHKILRKNYDAVSDVHTAEWVNRLTNDTMVAANGAVEILPGSIGTVVRLVSALIMIIALDRWFAYILIPGGLALAVLTYAFRKVLKQLHKNIQESDGRLRISLQEHIANLMVIKSFAAEAQTERQAAEKMEDHKAARMRRNSFSNVANIGFGVAMQGMYIIGAVYCAYGIFHGTVTYGTLTAIMQLIGQVQGPFANISGYLPRWYAMPASAERLMEIESLADDERGGETEEIRRFYQTSFSGIELRNVSFTYEEGNKAPVVLSDFSMKIRKGETMAFTGHSGCGKSTVLKLLLSMYPPDAGEICLLSSDGEMPLDASRRRLFAYVPQGNALMNGTIREVVCFAEPDNVGNEERLRRALQIACADEFVSDPDAVLGERGSGLSEGQMQRLAIARAVFSDAPILLLDESTSALDDATEKRLLENLRSLTDKTVIIVTHRKAALSICDEVVDF